MTERNHVTSQQLRELIEGQNETPESQSVAEHVHHCAECRRQLEALTAAPAIWEKVPAMLKDAPRLAPLPPMNSVRERSAEPAGTATDDWTHQWPVTDWLERPTHPEMLGRIGKYDVEREIGRGGMGVVLKGYDSELNRPVAIKILAPHLASHGTARKRFAQEVIAAGGILHPNVIPVYGVHHEGKTPFMVMPYIDGPSLQTLVEQQGPLSEMEIIRIGVQISSGLAAAHAQGLVHRDIKPANVLVDGGVQRVMITDFGLARAEDDASLTRTGWLLGTPNYMSPEQTRGQRLDGRSDLYSLGSLLYFLASGRLPFRAESALGVLHRIQQEEPTPIRQVNRMISQTLAAVIEKLLQKDPNARFQSAAELHDLLEKHLAYLHQPDISKPPVVYPDKYTGSSNTNFFAMIGAALTAVALLALFAWQFMLRTDDNAPSKARQDLGVTSTVLSDNPWQGKDLYCEAERLYHLEQYPAALAGFQEATQFAGVRAKSWYNIGCIQIKLNRLDLALAALQQSIELGYADENHFKTDPDLEELRREPRYLTLLSRIREVAQADELATAAQNEVSQGNLAVAEQHCRAALALHPIHGEAATQLGYVLHVQGRVDEAVPWHQVAAQSEDSQAMGNYNLACYYALKGQNSLALEHLNRAIRLGLSRCLSVQRVKQDSDLQAIINTPPFSAAIVAMEQYDQQVRQGLDPDLVAAYRAVGLDPTAHRGQIFQGFSAALVRDYQAAGLDLKKYNTMLQNRVPYALIERYQRAGLEPLEHETSLLQRREPKEIPSAEQSLEPQ